MGTNADKHARQKQNRAAARGSHAGSGRSRGVVIGGVVVAMILVAGVLVVFAGGSDDGDDTTTTDPSQSTETTVAPDAADLPAPPPGITLTDDTPCPPAEGTAERVQKFAGPPPTCIDPATTSYSATFVTNEGDFTAALDAEAAPVATNNFVVLSRYHLYDGVPFHRIVPDFVIQAGDGDGEPWGNNDLGYTFADELPADVTAYTDYSLTMANAGPDTNGSQFFVVLPGGGSALGEPLYSRFGEVVEGQDVIDTIGGLGGAGETGQEPAEAVVISSVTINETPR